MTSPMLRRRKTMSGLAAAALALTLVAVPALSASASITYRSKQYSSASACAAARGFWVKNGGSATNCTYSHGATYQIDGWGYSYWR